MDIFHTANTGDRSWPGTRLTIERRIRRRSELTESIILDSEPTIYSLQEVEERGRGRYSGGDQHSIGWSVVVVN